MKLIRLSMSVKKLQIDTLLPSAYQKIGEKGCGCTSLSSVGVLYTEGFFEVASPDVAI